MNQEVNPLTAFIIIAISVIMIYLIFWFRGESLTVGAPDQVKFDRQGNLVIHVGDRLVKLDSELQIINQIQLDEIGVYDLVGDFDFFTNGDILIRKGRYQPSLIDNVRRYFRMTETKLPIADNDVEGMFRCQLASKKCILFGSEKLDFDSAFHVSIDPQNDDVYVSDTGRHILRKFNQHGVELASQTEGFKYPNQISLFNSGLWVADTNHHAIQQVKIINDEFCKIIKSYSVIHEQSKENTWPYAFAKVGNKWWVNNLASNMDKGVISIFNETGQFERIIQLPDKADPFDIAVMPDQVLLTDINNKRIYQLDFQGNLLRNSLPDQLNQYLYDLYGQRIHFQILSYAATGLFILMIVVGLVWGWIQQRQDDKLDLDPIRSILEIDINHPDIKWIAMNEQRKMLLKAWFVIALIFPLLVFYIVWQKTDDISKDLVFIFILSLVLILGGFNFYWSKIGILKNILIIKKYRKTFSAVSAENVYYSDQQVMVGRLHIPLLQQIQLYNMEEIVQYFMPVLRDANYISRPDMTD